MFQYVDSIGVHYCGQTVGDDNRSDVLVGFGNILDGLGDGQFRLAVQATGGFVKDKQFWITEQGAGDRQTLTFATR